MLRNLIVSKSSLPIHHHSRTQAEDLQNAMKQKLILPQASQFPTNIILCAFWLRSSSSAAPNQQFTQVPMWFWKYVRFWLSRGRWERWGHLQKDEQQRGRERSVREEFSVGKNDNCVVSGRRHRQSRDVTAIGQCEGEGRCQTVRVGTCNQYYFSIFQSTRQFLKKIL